MDRNVCQGESLDGALLLGAVVSGDVTDLSWESTYYQAILDLTYHASEMLSDTSILQPTIEQHFEKTVTYYLTGTTSTNETCTDSVKLNFNSWIFLAVDKATGKSPSDTVELWIAAVSNWPHIKYEWSPNYMISDTTIERPSVWNDTTVFYNLTITDSLDCTFIDDVFEVYVNASSTIEKEEILLNLYPNPTSTTFTITTNRNFDTYELFELSGKMIQKTNSKTIDLTNEINGVYILKAKDKNANFISKKIVKKGTP